MKKNILIISDFFAPDNEIAAIRLTKIGKYLSLSGYKVDILKRGKSGRKEDILLKKDLKYFNIIFENYNSSVYNLLYRKTLGRYNKNNSEGKIKKQARKNKIIYFIKNIISFIIQEIIYFNYYYTAILRKDIQFENYDLIFSSYRPISSHLIGAFIKKKNKNVTWIADFRDSINNIMTPRIFWTYNRLYERKVLKNADIITVVSTGCFSFLSSKIHVIPNGFDEDDYSKNDENQKITLSNKYIYTYTGEMYGGKRNMRVFFRILKELIDEQIIKKENIEIRYLGRSAEYFFEQACDFLSKDIIRNYGFVSREEAIIAQNESNTLLLASWNDANNQGVITGKVYEYLMAEKPILCFINGNIADSELKNMIKSFEIGCCYEEANAIIDYPNMKNYIKEQIMNWKKNNKVKITPNYQFINKYNYKVIVKEIVNIIEKTR